MNSISYPKSFEAWRPLARKLLLAEVRPQELLWQAPDQVGLFVEESDFKPSNKAAPKIPKAFLDLARTVSCHRSGDQWALLYSLLWRLTHGERHLLAISTDPELHPVRSMAKSIGRDIHKMHAFVRFRKVGEDPETKREQFVAWFEPDHRIVRLASPFFRKRFASMDWSILTPDECVHWDGEKVYFSEGVDKSKAAGSDAFDDLWRTYYRSIFNPARLKVKAMQSEMPKKYWKNLPEAEVIRELITSSSDTTKEMLEAPSSPEKPVPKNDYLKKLQSLDEKA
ncbi:TIGR03915 family putative DNA repair protein [Haloferula sp.]|uniref:TIGR03915 family putative DNA repair protein n=1 Tax=Haloferula sp. TaxID=2497595 RepID=UPI00329C9C58